MKAKKPSKKQLVLDHLRQHRTITSWQAIHVYKATRLSDIIFNLRKEGYDIVTHNRVSLDGSHYAEYEYRVAKGQASLGL